MAIESDFRLDINTAEVDELIELPGVGSAMAEQICALRPFADIDDLRRVKGIGPAFLQKLAPHIESSFTEEDVENFVDDDIVSDVGEEESPEVVETPTEDDEISPEPSKKPVVVTRGQALMMALGSGFLAFTLALIFVFSILAGLNNGNLHFASPSEIIALGNQLENISLQLTTLEDDVDGLRTRLDNLEILSNRIRTAEDTLKTLNDDFEILQTKNSNIQTVLENLRDLLLELFPPAEEIK